MNIYYYYMSLAVGKSVVVEPEPSGTSSISGLPNKMSAQPNRVVLEKKELPQNGDQHGHSDTGETYGGSVKTAQNALHSFIIFHVALFHDANDASAIMKAH